MKNNKNLKNKLRKIQNTTVKNKKEFYTLLDQAEKILERKKITINDENFNGQPYGNSKKSLKGKSFIYTKDVFLYANDDGMLYIQPPGCNDVLLLDKCLIDVETKERSQKC